MNNKQQSFKDLYSKYVIWDQNSIKGFFEDYRFLSNFHLCDVYFEGLLYPSSESAYMAAKSTDLYTRQLFSSNPKNVIGEEKPVMRPAEARKFGQTIELRPDWDKIKYDMMLAIVFDKFWRNKDIREKLIATGDKYLEESCHWHDLYWAKCYCPNHNGKGQNNLGDILMKVRNILKK